MLQEPAGDTPPRPSGQPRHLTGLRTLVIGASSGIGHAFAVAAHAHGAHVAVAARRTDAINALAASVCGSAYELDVSDPTAVETVVDAAAKDLGGIDVVFLTSGVAPFARVEHVERSTWAHAFAVNAIGPALVIRAALPHLTRDAVIMVASSAEVGRPRAGTAPYSASKAALDEIARPMWPPLSYLSSPARGSVERPFPKWYNSPRESHRNSFDSLMNSTATYRRAGWHRPCRP